MVNRENRILNLDSTTALVFGVYTSILVLAPDVSYFQELQRMCLTSLCTIDFLPPVNDIGNSNRVNEINTY